MRYGFRVHKLELARGLRGRRLLELATCTNDHERKEAKQTGSEPPEKSDILDWLEGQVSQLSGAPETLTDIPKLIAVADGANDFVAGDDPGTPRLLVLKHKRAARRLHVEVEYGHLGYHHRAVGATRSEASDLTTKSPMQIYRLEFLVPIDGTRGLIASESISGGHALPMLLAWLNHRARQEKGDDAMVRIMGHPLTDLDMVLKLLDQDNAVAEVQLARTKNSTIDGVPSSGKIILHEEVVPGTKIQGLKKLLGLWYEKDFSYDEQGKLEQVKSLAEVVAPQAGGIGFDDGYIRLDAGNGKKVTVRPTRLGELYAYPISEHRPTDSMWEERVKDRLMAIATGDKLSVSWG